MFSAHNINSNSLSLRNLILLFLTIVLGFASVITLAHIDILSDIENARQTIARITITADGTNSQTFIEMSSGGIFINDAVMQQEYNFTGKVLGIDENGNLIYVMSKSLVVSGVSGGGTEDNDWAIAGNNIYRFTGNVGIGTNTPTGKLHIVNSGSTDIYIEEQAKGQAANFRLKNPIREWRMGADSNPDIFYIGTSISPWILNITSGGYVGIGTNTPQYKLDVNGTGRFTKGSLIVKNTNSPAILKLEGINNNREIGAIEFANDGDSKIYGEIKAKEGEGQEEGRLTFSTRNGANLSQAMRIDDQGNVSIGASATSTYKLDVNGSGRFTNALIVTGGGFYSKLNPAALLFHRADANYIWATKPSGYLAFGTNGTITMAGHSTLLLSASGKVGIGGIIVPQQALDVSGAIKVGNISFGTIKLWRKGGGSLNNGGYPQCSCDSNQNTEDCNGWYYLTGVNGCYDRYDDDEHGESYSFYNIYVANTCTSPGTITYNTTTNTFWGCGRKPLTPAVPSGIYYWSEL